MSLSIVGIRGAILLDVSPEIHQPLSEQVAGDGAKFSELGKAKELVDQIKGRTRTAIPQAQRTEVTYSTRPQAASAANRHDKAAEVCSIERSLMAM
ncbi:MAG: hypothetical protein LCH69_17375 [Proteobacteria bacterium]|nr:hypothetical protein [Pseudomonadota bacterium]